MNKEIENKYILKINELNKDYIKYDKDDNSEYCLDNENYHLELDNILLKILIELGYIEIVKMYERAEDHFWYS